MWAVASSVYVTASGATTTRKAAFDSPLVLAPGAHLLVANSAGTYAQLADATYIGGLAADGGSLALRHVGGAVIDAVSWGTASNAYVEGAVAPAPPARSSLERRPGGAAGNWVDTNDNASDWVVQSNPIPQSLTSTPTPAPSSSPPDESSTPTSISPVPSGQPSESPSPEPTGEPTAEPTVEPTAEPTVGPTVEPTAGATPTPTLEPTATPTPTSPAPTAPAIDLESVAAARSEVVGSHVHLSGVVTVAPGLVGADNLFAIADSSAGIFVRLAAPVDGVEVGRSVDIVGVLAAPYGQLEVRELEWLALGATDAAATPIVATLSEIGEQLEGSLVTLEGTIDSVTLDSGRLVLTLGDKQTELRVLADPPSGISEADVTRGEQVTLTGIVGQRATALGREDGYRLWLRMPSDLRAVVLTSPSPTATPSATGTPRPTATPTAGATPTPTLEPTATPTPTSPAPTAPAIDLESVAAARSEVVGSHVHLSGVVTVAPGLVGADNLFAIADSSAGIFVRLAAPVDGVEVGRSVDIVGVLAAPYGQLEVRELEWLALGATDAAATPIVATLSEIGEQLEGSLVTLEGTIDSVTLDSGRLVLTLGDKQTELRVLADPPSGISEADVTRGEQVTLTRIVGQRATALGREDGYRLWLRMPSDLRAVVLTSPSPTATPSATGTPRPTATPTAGATPTPTLEPTATPTPTSPAPTAPAIDLESVAAARSEVVGSHVHLSGVVTVAPGLVGADNLFAIADSSAGIFVRLAAPVDGVEVGRSVDIVGVLAAPYGQLEVRELEWLALGATDAAATPIVATLSEIGEQLEGSLVTLEGTIDSVTLDSGRLVLTLGDKQTELRVLADPPSGISEADVTRGEQVTLTGIVGQRATALGREDGYRLWLRMPSDLRAVVLTSPSPTATPSATGTPRPTATPTAVAVYHDLATGLAVRGRTVDVEATVTAAAGVIDWGGPTIVVDDGTAAVAVVLPVGVASPRAGAGVHIVGKTGSLHSGPRVVATLVEGLGDSVAVQPRQVSGALGPSVEWRLVSVCGRVQRLTRAGSRWRADLVVDGQIVAVLGEPGADIDPAGIVAGRLALATGIVRRSTSNSSVFQLLPRSAADVILGPISAASGRSASATAAGLASGSGASGASAAIEAHSTVAEIPGHDGETVTVAGLIVDTGPATATLDDGTGRVRLGGAAASDALSLLEPGDAVEVTGLVSRDADGWLIEVDPDRIVTLAGTASGAAAPSDRPSDGPSPSVEAASDTPGSEDEVPSARGQAHGLALPAGGMAGPDPIAIIALFGGGLALLALLGLTAARAAREGLLHRPGRPARTSRGAREARDVAPR